MGLLIANSQGDVLGAFPSPAAASSDAEGVTVTGSVHDFVYPATAGAVTSTEWADAAMPSDIAVRHYQLKSGVLTAIGPAPSPTMVPVPITDKLIFLDWFTDAQIASAMADTNFAVFWAKFNAAAQLERDATLTTQGLAALVAAGHITQADSDRIIANWPTA